MARKHNLILQDAYHPLDTHPSPLPITDNVYDLINLTSFSNVVSHQIAGQDPMGVNCYDLLDVDCWHDHISWHIYRFVGKQNLAMQDAYHVLTDADAAVIPLYSITCGEWPEYSLKLPVVSSTGEFGYRLKWGENIKLPTVLLEDTRTGFRTGIDTEGVESVLKLPTVSSEGVALMGSTMTVDRKLPAVVEYVDWDMRFGSNFAKMLPAFRLEAEVSGGLWMRVDTKLPGVECAATAWSPVGMWLDAKLPPVSLNTSQSIELYPTLDRKLPTLQIEAYCYGGPGAILDATLPPIRVLADDAEGTSGDILTLDATLPTVVMRPVGTGSGVDGLPGVVQDEIRFEDYVLRYARSG